MKILSWNVNGLRAVQKKGFAGWIRKERPDILCIQESRALPEQVQPDWPKSYKAYWNPAEKKGYSGTATWANREFVEIGRGMESSLDRDDSEGRIIHTKHPFANTSLHCINVYLPSGSNKEERQLYKEGWIEDLLNWAQRFTDHDEPVLLCGDLNIAHTENDIWNPSGNRFTSGFLPQEREWFSRLLASGWHDLFRIQVGEQKGPYSWWSNRGQARAKDRGWRIDYVLANAAARPMLAGAEIMREGGLVVSDHAPVIIDLAE